MSAPEAAAAAAPPARPAPRPMVTSAVGAAALAELYDATLAALPLPHEVVWVETSFGRTHVLVVGPPEAPPCIMFHGTACPAPFMCAGLGPDLPQRCRIYMPDIPGQAGSRSDPALLDPAQHGHGAWAAEVVAALGLMPGGAAGGPPVGAGTSLGAAVLLDLVVTCPEAVRGAALIAPVCLYPGGQGVQGAGAAPGLWREAACKGGQRGSQGPVPGAAAGMPHCPPLHHVLLRPAGTAAGTGAGKWMPAHVALGFLAYRLLPCRATARFALSRFADGADIDDPVMKMVLLGFRRVGLVASQGLLGQGAPRAAPGTARLQAVRCSAPIPNLLLPPLALPQPHSSLQVRQLHPRAAGPLF